MKYFNILIFFVGVTSLLLSNAYFNNSLDKKITSETEKSLIKVSFAYKAVIETYTVAAQKDYESLLANKEVMNLLKEFKSANTTRQNIIRGTIYRILHRHYKKMVDSYVRQFQIHTHNGESLLRFHLPYENQDSLLKFRTTVYEANINKKKMSGFEVGRVYPGYRYVFPIIYKAEHLGSVEFSISFEGVESHLKKLLTQNNFQLIMTPDSSIDSTFEWHRPFFIKSIWSAHYYTESPSLSPLINNEEFQTVVTPQLQKEFNEKSQSKKNFTLVSQKDEEYFFIHFVAFTNTDNEHAGYIVSLEKNEYVSLLIQEAMLYKYITLLIVLLIMGFLYLIGKKQQQVQNYSQQLHRLNSALKNSNEKLERFINMQENIVILTDGVRFQFANQSFYNFFGYGNLDSFLQEHNCICEYFIAHSPFFSLESVKENEVHWIESLQNLPQRKRIVSMYDKDGNAHAFSVGISKFENENYIVNFSDISETMLEKLLFEKQATKDSLTKAYNRTYLENSIETIRAFHIKSALKTAVIFFDIDHFKNINDTYGHLIGDAILQDITKLVHDNLRKDDTLVRWGGEEFLIVLGTESLARAGFVAELLRNKIEKHTFTNTLHVTCSFGVYVGQEHQSIEEIISSADKKLYEAKSSGRNRVVT